LLRALRPLVSTGWGRSGTIIVLAALVLGVGVRNPTAASLGWGAALFFTWGAASVVMLNTRRRSVVTHWKPFAGTLGLCVAMTGLLGMIGAPVGSPTGDSLGGNLGTVIASAPEQWDWFNVTPGQYALAALRVAVAFGVSLSLFSPPTAYKVSVLTGNAAMGAYGWAAAAGVRLWSRYEVFQSRKAGQKRRGGAGQPAQHAEAAGDAAPQPGPELKMSHRTHSGVEPVSDLQPAIAAHPAVPRADAAPEQGRGQTPPGAGATPGARPPLAVPPAAPVAKPALPPVPAPQPNYAWKMPRLDLLKVAPPGGVRPAEIEATGQLIVETLAQQGIDVSVDTVRSGPTVTMYGLKPGWRGRTDDPAAIKRVRVDTILAREKDLALALKSPSLRFEAPVPGEAVVGIEVPNQRPATVTLRSVMDTEDFRKFAAGAALPIPLGLSTGGEPVYADLAKMPHLLVAGATGSGKSVYMNALITGLLLTRTPYQLRMVMIDPKRVELTPFAGVPHLYTPVVVEPGRAVPILKALISEMMDRFRRLEQAGAKNIAAFNQKTVNKMPYILLFVDELADLMLTAAGDTERLLVRLAQMGRATGLHLVVATQRPSVDIVTGLIKANFPSRISFAVSSQVDSRTIIDSPGAEKLLGRGDMLFLPVDKPMPQRIQGAFLTDSETESVITHWKHAGSPPLPQLEVQIEEDNGLSGGLYGDDDAGETLTEKAAALARTQKTLSTSLLQRRLRIGYPRAARLMDELEELGIVGPGEPGKARQVLLHA
jgi:S-DNA-T family DNA segregation ATPase FtsK/SpoIIIE